MEYSKLEPSHTFSDFQHKHQKKRPWQLACAAGLCIFAITVVILVYAAMRQEAEASGVASLPSKAQQSSSTANLRPTDCGNDIDTAIANDCQLDILSSNWTPRLCRNEEFYHDAIKGHATVDNSHIARRFGLPTFEYFEDKNKTRPLRSPADVKEFLTTRARAGLPL